MAHKTYIRHTDGKTAVFFMHGFLGSPEHFERFYDVIPPDVAIYNILLKGHGKTVSDFSKASMSAWKKQVNDVMDELVQKYEKIIIGAHSMGTFFAMELAEKYPEKVSNLFLLQMPLVIGVRFDAFLNTFKTLFNLFPEKDEKGEQYKNSHSIKLTKCVWKYIGWIPRYLELFKEAVRAREVIKNLETRTVIFQSEKDELVSMKSVKYIPEKNNISVIKLAKSAHFIYNKEETEEMRRKFTEIIG